MARPLKYTDTDKLKEKIEEYFTDCDNREAPYTLIGLANALDINRSTIYRYRDYKDCTDEDIQGYNALVDKTKKELCTIITQAVNRIEQYTVEMLYGRDTYKGAQFLLACNYGYRDTKAIEIQSDKDISITIGE